MRRYFVLTGLICGMAAVGFAQSAYSPVGSEYAVAAPLMGDQMHSCLAISQDGGFLIWQDNFADGDGLGISAQRLNSSLSPASPVFRINQEGAGDQENPQASLLPGGGAMVVWQGGVQGFQKIYARILAPDGTAKIGDLQVNTYTNNQQITPAVATLSNGNVIVVWASYSQTNSQTGMVDSQLGVYGQRLSPTGDKLGGEFQINQTTDNNQRNPVVAALTGGGFAVAWITEQAGAIVNGSLKYNVRTYGRIFDAEGNPQTSEFAFSTDNNICATPSIASLSSGGFAAAWGELNVGSTNSWDIYARAFDVQGKPLADVTLVNTFTYGDQYIPKITSLGSDCLVVWTSMGQDGSREGVYGRFLNGAAQPEGDEFLVNTTTLGQQVNPAVASDGFSRFLVVWSSYTYGPTSYDLYGQRFAASQGLGKLSAPFVTPLTQSRISVTWPPLTGYSIDHYELFMDGATQPIVTTNNYYQVTGLAPSTSHSFQVLCQLADGRRSPLSTAASATTWGEDLNGDGLPDDWQAKYWGNDPSQWPAGNIDSDSDGATNFQEFMAGTDPTDPNSVLRTTLAASSTGLLSVAQSSYTLTWKTQPGFVYQVQSSTDLHSWTNFGASRFAAGTQDAMPVGAEAQEIYYRVIRLR